MILIRNLLYRIFIGFNYIPRRNFHYTTKKYGNLTKFIFKNNFFRFFFELFSRALPNNSQIARSIKIRLFYFQKAPKIKDINSNISFDKDQFIIDYGSETRKAYVLKNEEKITAELKIKPGEKLHSGVCVLENISEYYPKILDFDLNVIIIIQSLNKKKKISFPISLSEKKHGIIHTKTGENWFDFSLNLNDFTGENIRISIFTSFSKETFTMFGKNKKKNLNKKIFLPRIPCIAFSKFKLTNMKNKKKILLISGESLTDPYWLKEVHDNNSIELPNIDQLTQNSIRFSRSYSSGDSTLPSIMSYLSGIFPSQHTFGDYDIPIYQKSASNDLKYLAQILNDNGYSTVCLTSYPRFDPMHGWENGFDRFYQAEYPWSNNAPDASKLIRTFEAFKDDNLFVFLHLTRLHAPFLSSDNLQTPQTNKIEDLGCAHDGNFLPMYFSQLKVFDDQIGIIIDYLRRTNQYDDTMIILTGDHGVAISPNWDMRSRHYAHYEEHSRVPLIIKSPNHKNKNDNKIDLSPVSTQRKIFEYILSYNNISLPKYFQNLPQYHKEYEGLAISETVYHPKKNHYGLMLVSNKYKYWMLADVDWNENIIKKVIEEKLFVIDLSNGIVNEDKNIAEQNPEIKSSFQNKALNFFTLSSNFSKGFLHKSYPDTLN